MLAGSLVAAGLARLNVMLCLVVQHEHRIAIVDVDLMRSRSERRNAHRDQQHARRDA